jgi:plastocyanin
MTRLYFVLAVAACLLLPAMASALTYTTPNTADGIVESSAPVLGGTTWESDENIDSDGGTDFHFTWDADHFYAAITGTYADQEDGDYDWFIAFDTDQIPGSGATSDGYGAVTFTGTYLPDVIYYFAGGFGYYESSEWDTTGGGAWIWRGWSSACSYGGYDANHTSEICFPDSMVQYAESLAVCSWITDENQTQVVASFPSANPIGSTQQLMLHFFVAKDLGQNVSPVMLPVEPPAGAATVDNERDFEFTCTTMADLTPGDCGTTTSMTFYYTTDGSAPDTTDAFVAGTYDSCHEGADTTDTFYAIIPAADEAIVKWIAKGIASNGFADVSDTFFTFVQGGTAWVGNAGSSPNTCTVWAEIYVGDGGQSTYIKFPYTTDGSDPRVSAEDTLDGVFDTQLGNNDKFYAILVDPLPGDTVNWYAYGVDTHNNYAQTDTFFTFVQGDTADYYNMTCVPDSNFVFGEVAPKGAGAGIDFHWTTDGTDPKTSGTAHMAKGFFVEDTDTTGVFAAYLTADVGQTITWYGHVYGSDNSYSDTPNYQCVAGITSGPTLCNLTCVPDSAIVRASISPRGFGSEVGFYAYIVRPGGAQTDTVAYLENNYLRDEDTPGGDCGVPVGVFQRALPGSIAAGDTIKWYAYGYYREGNKYQGLFGRSALQVCVAETTLAGVDTKGVEPLVPRITNVPNPFGGSTEILFDLARKARVSITIYDIRGRQVDSVFEGVLSQGAHSVKWDGRSETGEALPSGIYFYRFKAGDFEINQKAIRVR